MKFLCDTSDDQNIVELLPNFAQEKLENGSVSCDELLMKLDKVVPKIHT